MSAFKLPYRPDVGECVQFWSDPLSPKPDGFLHVLLVGDEAISGIAFSQVDGHFTRPFPVHTVRHKDDPCWKDEDRRNAMVRNGNAGAFRPLPFVLKLRQIIEEFPELKARLESIENSQNSLARVVSDIPSRKKAAV